MAGAARGGNVVAVDAGLEAVRREHAVRGMAARAHRADDEAALDEPRSMNALGIPLHDLELLARVANGGLLSRAVAAGAQRGDVEGKRGRQRVSLREDVVRAVTLRARRRVLVLLRLQLAVRAHPVLLRHVGMAGGASHARHPGAGSPFVRRIHRRVALAARQLRMHRAGNGVGLDLERVTVLRRLDVGTPMAAQAAGAARVPAVRIAARLVGRMAGHARGNRGGSLRPSLDGDDLAVHVLEFGVTLFAGGRQILPRDRGTIVGGGQDVVCRVTRHTGRRDHQPLLREGPVDEFRVVRSSVRLTKLTFLVDRLPFRVARSAQGGSARGEHGGARIARRHNSVAAMAVAAARGTRVAAGGRRAVE